MTIFVAGVIGFTCPGSREQEGQRLLCLGPVPQQLLSCRLGRREDRDDGFASGHLTLPDRLCAEKRGQHDEPHPAADRQLAS